MGPRDFRASLGVLLLSVAACTSSSTSVTSPSAVRCSLELTLSPPTIGASGGNGQISITAGRECAWDARSETDWIGLVTPTTGQGDAVIGYTASPNPLVVARRGTVVINEQRVDVSQAASTCAFTINPSGDSVDEKGANLRVRVTTQPSCTWSAVSQAGWIQVDAGREGNGPGEVAIRVQANSGGARRGTVLVAGHAYTVAQAAASPVGPPTPPPSPAPPPTPTPPRPCTFDVSPSSESIGARGGERDVRVRADGPRCPWTAASNTPWIRIRDESGDGNGRVRYVVAPNTGAARSGTIRVASAIITVTQEGVP